MRVFESQKIPKTFPKLWKGENKALHGERTLQSSELRQNQGGRTCHICPPALTLTPRRVTGVVGDGLSCPLPRGNASSPAA